MTGKVRAHIFGSAAVLCPQLLSTLLSSIENRLRDGMDAANAASIPSRNRFQLMLVAAAQLARRWGVEQQNGKMHCVQRNAYRPPGISLCFALRWRAVIFTALGFRQLIFPVRRATRNAPKKRVFLSLKARPFFQNGLAFRERKNAFFQGAPPPV